MSTMHLGPRQDGWQRPVAVPETLSRLHGPTTRRVRLPLHVYSSGLGPGRDFDLSVEAEQIELYQIVLTEGRLSDVCQFLDADTLVRLWSRLWLSPHVRAAWRPLLSDVTS
ncbi:MAG: hypothetical protein WCA29_13885 [Jiangellales bacterium]